MARNKRLIIPEDEAAENDFDVSPTPTVTAPALAVKAATPPAKPEMTFKAAIAELKRLDTLVARTRDEEITRRRDLKVISKIVSDLQQLPPAPVWDANAEAADRIAAQGKDRDRASRLGKINAALNR
jgi:hypothetical protein